VKWYRHFGKVSLKINTHTHTHTTHHRVLLSNKEEIMSLCNSQDMIGTRDINFKQNKPDSEEQKSHVFFQM
jgi:hypothetical protein